MRFRLRFLFIATVVLGVATPALALTLGQLVGGASFSTDSLTFENFQASAAGSADPTFDDYAVQVLPDGFRISGPVSATLGQTGTLLLSYDVTTAGPGIRGASLYSSGVAVGTGSEALVAESLSGSGNALLGTLVGYSGVFAAVPFIDQRFALVPEPMTFLLLGAGMVGLFLSGRRRHEQ